MQPITVDVPAEYICVLKLFAGKNDFRHYMNGIAMEVGPKESRLVATDGFRLGMFRIISYLEQPTVDVPFTVILPNSLVEHVKLSKGPVSIEIDMDHVPYRRVRGLSLYQGGMSSRGQPIDGTYPDWRRVLPGKVSGQVAQFNPAFIGDLAKASAILHGKGWTSKAGLSIAHNGDCPAIIDLCHPDFTGVISPWKKAVSMKSPTWCLDTLQVKEEETVRERIARTKAA